MTLGWVSILRLGLVQTALGSIVVLTSSTLNRLMVVELALPAILPGLLVALHYGVQITRPSWGFLSDQGGNRSFWIVVGMAALAAGAMLAALGLVWMESDFPPGLVLSIFAYVLIGLGVGSAGTSVLALLATGTRPDQRGAAATITWLMMIAGIAVTASTVGAFLEPYSLALLLEIVGTVTVGAFGLSCLAICGIERRILVPPPTRSVPFRAALREVWSDPRARNFTFFVFLSMIAYFMQELILEPYAGLVFGLTPGESTALSGAQHGGVFLGMITVGLAVSGLRIGTIRAWVVGGCLLSAVALVLLATLGQGRVLVPLSAAVMTLGFANGVFAVSAIAAMMELAGGGRERREGTRMGLWGAAQAIAAGFGGLLGAALVDLFRLGLSRPADAFGAVFLLEAALFIAAGLLAFVIMEGGSRQLQTATTEGQAHDL